MNVRHGKSLSANVNALYGGWCSIGRLPNKIPKTHHMFKREEGVVGGAVQGSHFQY